MARRAQPGRNLARHKKGLPGGGPDLALRHRVGGSARGLRVVALVMRIPILPTSPVTKRIAGASSDRKLSPGPFLPGQFDAPAGLEPPVTAQKKARRPGGGKDRRGGRGAVSGVRTGPHGVSTPASFGCKYRMIHGARAGRLAPDHRRAAAGPGGVAGRHGPEEEARRPRGGTSGSAGTEFRNRSFPTARADAVPDGSFEGPYGIFADSVPARGTLGWH